MKFEQTRWSLISRLRAGENNESAYAALEELCQIYWPPLYAYLRREGHDEHTSKDLIQGFFEMALKRELFAAADQEKGKLRSFLVTALQRFTAKQYRDANAQKRGGNVTWVWLDSEAIEAAIASELADQRLTPEQAYDRRWACTLLYRVLERLREEHEAKGKLELCEALIPILGEKEGNERREVADKLHFTPNALNIALYRFRTRYKRIVREEVAATLLDGEDIEEEIRALMAMF